MWEAPYSLPDIRNEDIIVLALTGSQEFDSKVVEPYVAGRISHREVPAQLPISFQEPSTIPQRERSFISTNVSVQMENQHQFERSVMI